MSRNLDMTQREIGLTLERCCTEKVSGPIFHQMIHTLAFSTHFGLHIFYSLQLSFFKNLSSIQLKRAQNVR